MLPCIADSATAIANPPSEQSCALLISEFWINDLHSFWTLDSKSKSMCGVPATVLWRIASASLPLAPCRLSQGESAPISTIASPSFRKAERRCSVTSSMMPSAPMIGVGYIAVSDDSLYRLALPLTTGMLNVSAASAMPAIASVSWYCMSCLSGFPKFNPSVIATGFAPTDEMFRHASATAIAAPARGSR